MRRIGKLPDESHARTFSDVLYVNGIDNQVDPASDGTWEIWVNAEQHIDTAQHLLERYRGDPDDPEFQGFSEAARQQRSIEEKKQVAARARFFDRHRLFPATPRAGALTKTLIAASILVAILSRLGSDKAHLKPLLITQYRVAGEYVQWRGGLPEIRRGQVWRLLTPMFIHFGIMHLLFNMLWLKDLGGMIEARQGTWLLAVLVLVIAATSNLGQYAASGPAFGGMSGVVYGLLGYIWIRGKFDPTSGLFVHKQTVTMMIVWFFLCLSGVIGNVANAAHGVGFGVGIAWGFISARVAAWRIGR